MVVTYWSILWTFFLTLTQISLSFLFLSLLCDLQNTHTIFWRTFPVTETWRFIYCQGRRNNNRVAQRLVQWEGGSSAVLILPPSSLCCLVLGQHGAQHYLNPSTAVVFDTVAHFLTVEICPFSAQSVNFLCS